MFCNCLPCECNAPAKKTAPKKRAVKFSDMQAEQNVVDVHLLEPKPTGMREAMRAAAAEPQPKPQAPVESLDAEMLGALSVLVDSGILHSEEVEKYKDLVTPQARTEAWKERRRNRELARKA